MATNRETATSEDLAMRSAMERMANSYDSYMRVMTLGRDRALREMTVKLAQVKPGDQVLEVGCGTGSLTLAAKRQAGSSGRAYGIDQIPRMIELSRQKAERAGEEITFQLGGIDAIPFPDGQFDVVLCSFMIFHMSEGIRRRGLAEIRRVLKPGGQLLVLDMARPANAVERFVADRLFGGMMQHDLRELLPVLTSSGFAEPEIGGAPFRVAFLSVLGYVRACARSG